MRSNPRYRHLGLVVGALLATASYLFWRIGWTLGGSLWLSVPLVVAEVVLGLRFALWCTTVAIRPGPQSPEGISPLADPERHELGDVEVLVPVAHRSIEEIARTLLVLRRDGVTVRALDITRRDDVAAEVARFDAAYDVVSDVASVERADLDAAIIEAARASVTTPFFAWVNAGDVPVPGFFTMLDSFDAPDVAVVQATVDLINHETLRRVVPRGDDTALTHDVVGPSLDVDGAAPWDGSGSIVRVAALDSIGGLALGGGSPTRRASMRFSRTGFVVRRPSTSSIRLAAPEQLDEYLDAAAERARGDWVLLGSDDSPLRGDPSGYRAGAFQRHRRYRRAFAQLHDSIAPLDAAARVVIAAVIAAVLFSATMPFAAPLALISVACTAQLVLRTMVVRRLAGSAMSIGDTSRQGLRLAEARLRAAMPNRVTRPGGQLRLLTGLVLLIDVALLARGVTFVAPDLLPRFTDGQRLVVMGAAVVALLPMVDVLGVLVGVGQRRSSHRVETELVAEVDGRSCRTVDLTPHGMGFVTDYSPGENVEVALWIPRLDGGMTAVSMRGDVRHRQAIDNDAHRVGLVFGDMTSRARDALVEFCALTAEQRDPAREDAPAYRPDALAVSGRADARTAIGAVSVASLLLASTVVMAGPAAAAEKGGDGMPTGSITGTVIDSQGSPVDQMCVSAWNGSDGGWSQTDEFGSYTMHNVPAGSDYKLTAGGCWDDDYAPTYYPSTFWYSDAVGITVGNDSTNADITVLDGATVSGTALDEAGDPLSNICVNAVQPGGQSWQWIPQTSDDGTFVGVVPSGTEFLVNLSDCDSPSRVVSAWVGGGDMDSATTFHLKPSETRDLGSIVMNAGASISGTVTDSQGSPLGDVCIDVAVVHDGWWDNVEGTHTDADGTYQLTVEPGTYSLSFEDCNDRHLVVPQWYPGVDRWGDSAPEITVDSGENTGYDVVMPAGGRVAGVVTDSDGGPAAGACTALLEFDGEMDGDWPAASWERVADDGTWISDVVSPGEYVVFYTGCDDGSGWLEEARRDFLPDVSGELSDIEPVTVVAGETLGPISDDLVRASTVGGTVTDSETGAPISDVCITGLSRDGVQSNDDGTWMASVAPGEYDVVASDCQQGRGYRQTTTQLSVNGNQEVNLSMTAGATGSISGSVLTPAGDPLAPLCGIAYVPDELIGMALGEDGRFEIEGLGAGTYNVGVFSCEDDPRVPMIDVGTGDEYGPMWFPGVPIEFPSDGPPSVANATPVVVTAGDSTPADFCLGDCEEPEEVVPPTVTVPDDTIPEATVAPTTVPPTTVPTAPVTSPSAAGFAPAPRIPANATAAPDDAAIAASASARNRNAAPVLPAPPENLVLSGVEEGSSSAATASDANGTTTSAVDPATDGSAPDPAASSSAARELSGVEVATFGDGSAVDALVPINNSGSSFPWDVAAGIVLLFGTGIALVIARQRPLRT